MALSWSGWFSWNVIYALKVYNSLFDNPGSLYTFGFLCPETKMYRHCKCKIKLWVTEIHICIEIFKKMENDKMTKQDFVQRKKVGFEGWEDGGVETGHLRTAMTALALPSLTAALFRRASGVEGLFNPHPLGSLHNRRGFGGLHFRMRKQAESFQEQQSRFSSPNLFGQGSSCFLPNDAF